MKIRNGFVSNSSSTSFLVQVDKSQKTISFEIPISEFKNIRKISSLKKLKSELLYIFEEFNETNDTIKESIDLLNSSLIENKDLFCIKTDSEDSETLNLILYLLNYSTGIDYIKNKIVELT